MTSNALLNTSWSNTCVSMLNANMRTLNSDYLYVHIRYNFMKSPTFNPPKWFWVVFRQVLFSPIFRLVRYISIYIAMNIHDVKRKLCEQAKKCIAMHTNYLNFILQCLSNELYYKVQDYYREAEASLLLNVSLHICPLTFITEAQLLSS